MDANTMVRELRLLAESLGNLGREAQESADSMPQRSNLQRWHDGRASAYNAAARTLQEKLDALTATTRPKDCGREDIAERWFD